MGNQGGHLMAVMGEDEVRKRKTNVMSPKDMDNLFSKYADTKQNEETTKEHKSKSMMRDLQDKAPTYVLMALAVAVVLLTIGGTFHEEPSEEQSHYSTLGIK